MTDQPPGQGHNNALRTFVERIEAIDQEIAGLNQDKKTVYTELKVAGFEPSILRLIVAERRLDPEKRRENATLMKTYRELLGMTE